MTVDETQRTRAPSFGEIDTIVEQRTDRSEATGTTAATLVGSRALQDEALARGRVGGWVTLVVSVLGLGILQLSPHRSLGHWLTTASLVALAGYTAWMLWRIRRHRDLGGDVPTAGLITVAAVLSVTLYLGLLSPVVAVLPVAVYFFGLDDSPRRGWLVLLAATLGYLVVGILTFTGVAPLSKAVLALAKDYSPGMVGLACAIEALLVCTFVLARLSRRATVTAMLQLEQARQQIQRRDALLDEAHADLDDALRAGKVGRFTGHRVGRFVAADVIGRGAIGEVYAARDPDGGQPAALKLLHPYVAEDPTHVERFFREVRILESLRSPHVVQVLESGRAADGSPYLAMELLDGHDLATLLRGRRRLGLREVVELVTQVARGLEVAQEAGIVHRDVKPRNLICLELGDDSTQWKVLDFGISKIAEGAATLTRDAIVGTPSYMSPEQAAGENVDHRSDLFSLALVAYRALTGRPAFTGPDPAVTLANIRYAQPIRPGQLVKLAGDVDLAFALALAKDRERRFRSATSFAAAFRDASRGELDERFRESARAILAEQDWGVDRVDRARAQ